MSKVPLLERRSPLGVSYALLILLIFFFCLPSAFRAARLSLQKRENDVKDWLPKDFPETAELEWFAKYFAGESFVLATWDGCTSGNKRLKLLEQKLRHESSGFDPTSIAPEHLAETYQRAKKVGVELQLLHSGDDFLNWGGKQEKWLRTPQNKWYYITPDGRLYRWDATISGPMAAYRALMKSLGKFQLDGQFIAAFGDDPGDDRVANPFYNDTSLLCAPLFETVQTGDTIVADLASPGGPLWPTDLIDEDRRPIVARRRAMQRLTGILFAPAVPRDFAWTPTAFRNVIPDDRRSELPADFEILVEYELSKIIEERFEGQKERLLSATTDTQSEVWYDVFDRVGIEPPPRLTCILVTLTDLAKENLKFALGRGVLGEPRGRLLILAEASGLRPPPSPSMAPPPFDRQEPDEFAGVPALRMGGPPVDNMAIDEEGSITLVRLVGYSVLVGIVVSYLCFRSIKIMIMVFVVGGSAALLSMAIVFWTVGRVDAILMSMPALVYVLGLSGAIHVVNYYRDEVRKRGRFGAASRALRHAFVPCSLAAITTAIGLISLVTSNLAPISNFGLYSAIGVVMTLGILFSYLPAALQYFAPDVGETHAPKEASLSADDAPSTESPLAERWARMGHWITTRYVRVAFACLAILFVGAVGFTKIKTSVQLLKLFDPDSRIIRDYAWLETNFGKLVPMELILRVTPQRQAERLAMRERSSTTGASTGSAAKSVSNAKAAAARLQALEMIERVETVSRIRQVVIRTLGEPGKNVVGSAVGADTFLPPLPPPTNSYNPIRSKLNKELLAAGDDLRNNDYLRIEESGPFAGSELWRISLRVAALSDVDYGLFIATLREAVEPVMRAYDTRDQLLEMLAAQQGRLQEKRVMLVGSPRPRPIAESELLLPNQEIDRRATYIATLGELLQGEPIETPQWLHTTPEKARELVASDQWPRVLEQFDAVIWLGSDSFHRDDLKSAQHMIDGLAILNKPVAPKLLPDRTPDVEGAGALKVVYTGVVPVVYKAQRTLLHSLTTSIALAFIMIAAVMGWLLNPDALSLGAFRPANLVNGLVAGMIAMIPNVFPVVIVFGTLAHLGIAIDIGTMMTASVAMGVAVDDTIHFLNWFRDHIDKGMNRIDAIIQTYRRVGPAMTQTTIVGGLGLFVFSLSTFTPTQRFGTLMLVLLATALVGDLILFPALLASPLGKFFKPRVRRQSDDESVPDDTDQPGSASERDEAAESAVPSPQLRVHFPVERTDASHRIKGS